MFPPRTASTLAQRTLGALALARSFLLLEDGHEVDWEVDGRDEPTRQDHPHRAPLRGPGGGLVNARRRGGQLPHGPQPCLSPIAHGRRPQRPWPARAAGQRGRTASPGSSRPAQR